MKQSGLDQAVRAEVYIPRAAAPDQPIFGVMTMEKVISESLSSQRLYLVLIGLFALIAVTLACAGVYGVLSYLVAQRTREFGVRMALGASSRDVLALVLRNSIQLGALAVSRVLQQFLYEVKPREPVVYLMVSAIILAVVVAANLVPARRTLTKSPPLMDGAIVLIVIDEMDLPASVKPKNSIPPISAPGFGMVMD